MVIGKASKSCLAFTMEDISIKLKSNHDVILHERRVIVVYEF
jgi:hypothetical protein